MLRRPQLVRLVGADANSLRSWKVAFDAFSDLEVTGHSPTLEAFLLDNASVALLRKDLGSFPIPTPQTKAALETRTAAIHVTSSSNGKYDIVQIKADAIWLSQQATIDEESALRIVVLEWQGRPTARILRGYTEEEKISLQQAVGTTEPGASIVSPGDSTESTVANGAKNTSSAFNSQENRRGRHLRLYLLEKKHILGIIVILATTCLLRPPIAPHGRSYGLQSKKDEHFPWLTSVGSRVFGTELGINQKTRNHTHDDYVVRAVQALRMCLTTLANGSGWTTLKDWTPELEYAHQTSHLDHMVQVIQLILVRITASTHLPSSAAVKAWFEFVGDHGFFDNLQTVSGSLPWSQEHTELRRGSHHFRRKDM